MHNKLNEHLKFTLGESSDKAAQYSENMSIS